jgi:PAS domain-containing protein
VLFEQKVAFDAAVRYELAETLTLRNRSWRLEAAAPPGLSPEGPSDRPRLVLIVGLLISALLSGLTWSLLNTARHARELARRVGVTDEELRESERRLALALESSGLAMFDWDLRSGLVHLGARWSEIVGGEPGPRVTPIQELERLVHPDDLPGLRERLRQLLKGETPGYCVEHRVRKASGNGSGSRASQR